MYFGAENWILLDGEIYKDFLPYMYVCGGLSGAKEAVKIERTDLECWDFDGLRYRPTSTKAYRVYARFPLEIRKLREKIENSGGKFSQSYIVYGLRASLDLKKPRFEVPQAEELLRAKRDIRIMAVDVEVRSRDVYYAYYVGDDVVVTRDAYDVFAAADVDYIVTYNGDSFDMKYLLNHGGLSSKYYLDTPYGYKPHVDLFVFADGRFKSAFGLSEEGKSLPEVAYQLGLISNEELRYKMKRKDISTMDEAELKSYVSIDVKLTHRIADKWLRILEALSLITGIDPMAIRQTAENASTALLAEALFHKRMEMEGAVLIDRRRKFGFPGGDKVKAAQPGLYRDVLEADFAAMYPTTYYWFKVNPIGVRECSDGFEVATEAGRRRLCFDESPISEVMALFYKGRKATKAVKDKFPEADQAIKILANSAYGKMSSTSWGIVNEWAGAFIFQYTEEIFKHLWERFKGRAIYGDTDSLYLMNADERTLEEVNAEAKKFGELYEVKEEGRWEYMLLVPTADGNTAAEKAYVKVGGDHVVIKGAKLRPHNMPVRMRYGGWREMLLKAFFKGRDLSELIEEFVRSAEIEELFVEKSTTLKDIFYTSEGRKKRLDHMSDVPMLFKLAVENGGSAVVTENSINGKKAAGSTILDVLHIPLEANSTYVIHNGRSYLVKGSVQYDGTTAKASVSYVLLSEREVRKHAMAYLAKLDAVRSIERGLKMGLRDASLLSFL